MVITLIGYRGCGKSTVAPALAARLGWSWLDADAVLEQREARSIRDLFAAEGEPYFRERESEILAELTGSDRLIVAAGGGAVLRPDNRAALRAGGPVVWLEAPVDVLERRIAGDAATAGRRPNLTATGGRREIEQLLALREPLYRETATLVVASGDRPLDDVVSEIVAALPPLS